MTAHAPIVFSADAFEGLEVPDRDWYLDGLIPLKTVTQINADGATGKSLLMAQVAVAGVTGTDSPIGIPMMGPVLFLSAEDDRDELHRRLDAITRARGLALSDLADLRIMALAGLDAVLAAPRPGSSAMIPTERFAELVREVESIRPALVALDTQADVFAGNENDRAQVRQFIGILRGLAIKHNLAVALLAHPSVAGISTGSGYSGSTGWNNSVRSRLYLDRVKDTDGTERDPDLRLLKSMKSNYGPRGQEWRLRWVDGRFIPDMPSASTFGQDNAEDLFLSLLMQFNADGRNVSPSPSNTYAPAIFAKHDEAMGTSKAAFARAMDRLFKAQRIAVETFGPASKPRTRLIVKDAA